jgi:hypothetical protein
MGVQPLLEATGNALMAIASENEPAPQGETPLVGTTSLDSALQATDHLLQQLDLSPCCFHRNRFHRFPSPSKGICHFADKEHAVALADFESDSLSLLRDFARPAKLPPGGPATTWMKRRGSARRRARMAAAGRW